MLLSAETKLLTSLYVIIDRATLEARGVGVRAFAEELREGGVRLVQYRDKVGGPQEVLRACAEIEAAFDGVEAKLVLNDRADLAALRRWGVHVGQGDLGVGDAWRVLGAEVSRSSVKGAYDRGTQMVGVSTHTVEEVRVAALSEADYVAVGPVFATSTKVDAEPVVGLEGVRRARALTTKPLVAIGGISLENCRDVVEAGADSVAVISGMFVAGRGVREVAEDFLERMR
jgi:thiamine-phosphate pyrophosphorylase